MKASNLAKTAVAMLTLSLAAVNPASSQVLGAGPAQIGTFPPAIFDPFSWFQVDDPNLPVISVTNGGMGAVGRFGINTPATGPLSRLEIFGAPSTNWNDVVVHAAQNSADLILTNRVPGRRLRFGTTPAGWGADIERMVITDWGNVGIGISDVNPFLPPERRLTVRTMGMPQIRLGGWAGNWDLWGDFNFQIMQDVGGMPTTHFLIDNGGNVGIGVMAPANKLEVCGTIRAKEVKVEIGWCDFVFEKDYQLMPLDELEEHVMTKKHLPGIPTAAEVEANGVDIGAATSQLLQKVEELTLYVIQLKKENDALKQESAELKERVANIESAE